MQLLKPEALGVGRTTKLAMLLLFLLVGVSMPIAIVALAKEPQLRSIPLQQRPDYKAGFAAGAAVVQTHYEARFNSLKSAGLCHYAQLVCKAK